MSKQNVKQIAADFCVNFCIENNLKPNKAELKRLTQSTVSFLVGAQNTITRYLKKEVTK